MTEPRDIDIEDPNDNPDEVTDDGLGVEKPEPVDPADVDESDDDGSTVDHHEGD